MEASSSSCSELRRSRRIAGLPVAKVPRSTAIRTEARREKRREVESVSSSNKKPKQSPRDKSPKPDEARGSPWCSICMNQPGRFQVSAIDSCVHEFCFDCISTWSQTENSCPLCKQRFTQVSRVHKARKCSNLTNTLVVEDRNQRSTITTIVIWGPRGQEWAFEAPRMPQLFGQEEREAFLHHIFIGAMGALQQPITVDVYATSHPPPRRRRSSTGESDPENDNRFQVWISNGWGSQE